ncbi:unnamed protein product [Heligmosomoides polygyrus]|uniref:Uncharacterized protein n=1 Tax=Heligmosomoides polygyrus TaxID=6339 RepID=A0A183FND1_HELPZ|nr:unnamed protein product [Heligmosomoides polygyrus]
MRLWKETGRLQNNINGKIAESLVDPVRYENMFPEWSSSLGRTTDSWPGCYRLGIRASVHQPEQKRNGKGRDCLQQRLKR